MSADEDATDKGGGLTRVGRPMQVGVGYTVRDCCDGQSLASPGRWPVAARRYLETDVWQEVVSLLMDLALGRVEAMPFPAQDVALLKDRVIAVLRDRGLSLQRLVADRDELPVDFRFLDLLLRASGDPWRHLGAFAQGVKVGPGTRMPRLPARYGRRGDGDYRNRETP